MSITSAEDLEGIKRISEIVAITLKKMRNFARAGLSTLQMDDFGAQILSSFGAQSAPKLVYDFPGWTCISVNKAFAHGVPSDTIILKEGDLINIDVSAELNGFWSDNGGSFILGKDIQLHAPLVNASHQILLDSIQHIRHGVRLADFGGLIETAAHKNGFRVIRNLAGHGVGRSLHEDPTTILNYCDKNNPQTFTKNSVVAIETFIATKANNAVELRDGWTLAGDKGGFVAQHEHTIIVTNDNPIILTALNGI